MANIFDRSPTRKTYYSDDGFSNGLGNFLTRVRNIAFDVNLSTDVSLKNSAVEGVGTDGGFAVPPRFESEVMLAVTAEDPLLLRCDVVDTDSNSLTMPVDQSAPWDTAEGIRVYWHDEAAALTQSKPALGQTTTRLGKITALVPVTDELFEDAPGLATYVSRKVPEKLSFALNLAIIQGNGVGRPLGILNAPATITTAKESGQPADTLVSANIIKMYSALYGPSRRNAIWLMHPDIEPELFTMSVAGPTSDVPFYTPANSTDELPRLLGCPIIVTEACEALGDKGDVILADLSAYRIVRRPLKEQQSLHVWFDRDLMAFKFVLRINGHPWWDSTITSRVGNGVRSAFITLAERA